MIRRVACVPYCPHLHLLTGSDEGQQDRSRAAFSTLQCLNFISPYLLFVLYAGGRGTSTGGLFISYCLSRSKATIIRYYLVRPHTGMML